MSIAKFIPRKINQWEHHKTNDLEIWIAGYDSLLLLKKIIDTIPNGQNINKKLIKSILMSINNYFYVKIITQNSDFTSESCIKSYSLFWRNINNNFFLSPQETLINIFFSSKIHKKKQLIFQTSDYNIGSLTLWKIILRPIYKILTK
jgi:hypothetical protein